MAAKNLILRKQLIKEGILGVLMLAAFAGGAMVLSNYDDDAQAQKRIKEGENASIHAEHETIKQDLATGFNISEFYHVYSQHRNGSLQIKRDTVTRAMSALLDKHHLMNLSVTISPITDTAIEFGQIKGTAVKSDIKLSFGALTDSSAYDFLSDLESKLPGILLIKEIKLTRQSDPSREMLVGLSQHKLMSLVQNEITLVWLGVRTPNDDQGSSSNGSDNGL